MSIAQVTNIQQDLSKLFGENQGYWEYRDKNNNFLCYTVRKTSKETGKKYFIPFIYENNKWLSEFFKDIKGETIKERPIYNVKELYDRPDCPVLLVEGEKTADAGKYFFPEMVCVTWLGGSGKAKNAEFYHLEGRTVYFIPDNDESGYKAADVIIDRLLKLNIELHFVDIKQLGVPENWDIADLYDDYGTIGVEDVLMTVRDCPQYTLPVAEFDGSSYPDMSDATKPKPLDTAANLKHMLDFYKINTRWNMMARIREITIPGTQFYMEERDNAALHHITDMAITHNLPSKRVDKHLDAISWDNTYHPVRDWILSAPLSDHEIFDKFLTTIKTTNDDLSFILLRRWLISAICAVFTESGFCAQGVLVIQGEPNTHKSSFVMSLAPQEMRAIKGGLSLDPSKKDDIFTSAEYWIAELGELDATFRKADIARLKSHITNDIDDVRRPHAVRNSRMMRRTVYAATVNEARFLVDKTGNRRWWTISVTEPIQTRHGLNMQQLWRYVYELYLKGESPFLTSEEMEQLNEMNKEYEFLDPFEEKLETHFDWEWPDRLWMNSSEVLQRIGYDKPTTNDCTRMGTLLTKMKIQKGTGRKHRHYFMPIFLPPR